MKAKLVKENLNEWFNIFNKKNKNQSEKNNDMNNDLSDDQIVMNIIKYIERLIDENNWEFLDIEKQPMKGIHKKYICTLTKNNEGYTIEVDTLNWINIENVELDVSENIINELINILEHEYERRQNVIKKKNEDDYEIARQKKLENIRKNFN